MLNTMKKEPAAHGNRESLCTQNVNTQGHGPFRESPSVLALALVLVLALALALVIHAKR